MNNLNDNNNALKINTFQKFKSHIIICEDILKTPLLVREHALQKYNYCIKKAYGYICSWGFISHDMLELFAKLLKMNIFLKACHFLFKPKFVSNYPHTDTEPLRGNISHEPVQIAGLIYLNPDLDKINYTCIYDTYSNDFMKISNVTSFVGNRFNKCVLYDGSILHAPGDGFGIDEDKPELIRLVATYFCRAEHSTIS